MPAKASHAVNQAIFRARSAAATKRVWLVYQINGDDDSIGTLTSQAEMFGEVYEGLRGNFDAPVQKTLAQQLATLEKEKKSAQDNKTLTKTLRTEIFDKNTKYTKNAREEYRSHAELAKGFAEEMFSFKDIGARFPAMHAEENFITAWSSISNAYKTSKQKEIEGVRLYLNYSPCVEGSAAKKIGEISYPEGCLYKLRTLAIAYNNISWTVHYDEYFAKPSEKECRNQCLLVAEATPNLKFWKLKL